MMRARRRTRTVPSTPALVELEDLADSAVVLAQQIKDTVAALRRQDTRGDDDDDGT